MRRLEGQVLFPVRDSSGTHRFDEVEVADVARRMLKGGVAAARSAWLTERERHRGVDRRQRLGPWCDAGPLCDGSADGELRRLRRENAELRAHLQEVQAQFSAFFGGARWRLLVRLPLFCLGHLASVA